MKVLIRKASDWNYHKVKEINTLEELLKIYPSLIVDSGKEMLKIYKNSDDDYDKDFKLIVTIYDYYVE